MSFAVAEYQFADVRGLVGTVGHECVDTVELLGDPLIQIVKGNAVMDIAGGDLHIQDYAVAKAGATK